MFRSSILVTLITLSASALGFAVQLLLASRYGISIDLDAYLFAISVPTFIAGTISAMMSYELVPRLVACETDQSHQRHYITTLIIAVTGLSLLLGSIGSILGMVQTQMLPISSPIKSYTNLPHLILIGWVICAFQVLQGCLTAILNAHRRYRDAALLALLPYLGMILLLLTLGDFAGIRALALGMLTGTVLATLSGIFIIRRHICLLKSKQLLWQEIRALACSSPYSAMAMTCFSSYAVVDAYWAPLAGPGTLATLGFAQRVVIAFGNLAVAGPSAVLVPRFAELMREKNIPGFRRSLRDALLVIGGISSSIAVAMAIFARELVELLFARGSFGPNEVEGVAEALRYMTPGMVMMLLSVIILRALFCLNGTSKVAALLGLLWAVAYFMSSAWLYSYGVKGIACAYSIVWALFCFSSIFFIYQKTKKC